MKYTSAQANQLLKKLMEEREELLAAERRSSVFLAATVEDVEDARPNYDYADTQKKLSAVEEKIRAVKHAISVFNTTHTVEGFQMTADQMLGYLPQLKDRKARLGRMAGTLPKTRVTASPRSSLIEYQYANYDVGQAKADYEAVSAALSEARLALDKLNTTETMEIEL